MRTSARAGTSPENQTGAARGCWEAQTWCWCRVFLLLLRLCLYSFIHFCIAQYCEYSLEYKTITESSTDSSNPHFLPSPRPPSVDPAASANPIPDNKQTVNVPPATNVASRPQGWLVCTLCKSRAFSSESDLADHQVVCATHDVSAATAIRESLAAKEQAQARAQAELRDRLSSAKAQVAALQQQIQQTQQQMVPSLCRKPSLARRPCTLVPSHPILHRSRWYASRQTTTKRAAASMIVRTKPT